MTSSAEGGGGDARGSVLARCFDAWRRPEEDAAAGTSGAEALAERTKNAVDELRPRSIGSTPRGSSSKRARTTPRPRGRRRGSSRRSRGARAASSPTLHAVPRQRVPAHLQRALRLAGIAKELARGDGISPAGRAERTGVAGGARQPAPLAGHAGGRKRRPRGGGGGHRGDARGGAPGAGGEVPRAVREAGEHRRRGRAAAPASERARAARGPTHARAPAGAADADEMAARRRTFAGREGGESPRRRGARRPSPGGDDARPPPRARSRRPGEAHAWALDALDAEAGRMRHSEKVEEKVKGWEAAAAIPTTAGAASGPRARPRPSRRRTETAPRIDDRDAADGWGDRARVLADRARRRPARDRE